MFFFNAEYADENRCKIAPQETLFSVSEHDTTIEVDDEPLVRTKRIERNRNHWDAFTMAAKKYAQNSKNDYFMKKFETESVESTESAEEFTSETETDEEESQQSPDGVELFCRAEERSSDEKRLKKQKMKD